MKIKMNNNQIQLFQIREMAILYDQIDRNHDWGSYFFFLKNHLTLCYYKRIIVDFFCNELAKYNDIFKNKLCFRMAPSHTKE